MMDAFHVLIQAGSALFIAYLGVSMPLPVLSLYSTVDLGLDIWPGGFALACSFIQVCPYVLAIP
jgi:hypothetical protein